MKNTAELQARLEELRQWLACPDREGDVDDAEETVELIEEVLRLREDAEERGIEREKLERLTE